MTGSALKQDALFEELRGLGSVIVAYSGGADSAYLAWAAHQILGEQAIAITADSASFPESHKRDAEEFARESGFRHETIETREFDNPDYVKNGPDRCFHCKDELFARLDEVARERGIAHVIYGVNVDDLGDYRPGQHAAKLHQVKAPLVEERGDEDIQALGFRQFRVRFHGDLVRIEIAPEELERALAPEMARAFTAIFKPLGFHYVTLDLEGYRQGSLNAGLLAAR
jgi:uncharacterized protein